jgi:hypothetical protein
MRIMQKGEVDENFEAVFLRCSESLDGYQARDAFGSSRAQK